MSTGRGSGAGGVQTIPAGSRMVVQSLKEIVNCPEAEIYATLKDCNMDPNEAINRLLSQGVYSRTLIFIFVLWLIVFFLGFRNYRLPSIKRRILLCA